MQTGIQSILKSKTDTALQLIANKIYNSQRITEEDGLLLFEKASLPFLGSLANHVRERMHGDTTYFNRNNAPWTTMPPVKAPTILNDPRLVRSLSSPVITAINAP